MGIAAESGVILARRRGRNNRRHPNARRASREMPRGSCRFVSCTLGLGHGRLELSAAPPAPGSEPAASPAVWRREPNQERQAGRPGGRPHGESGGMYPVESAHSQSLRPFRAASAAIGRKS